MRVRRTKVYTFDRRARASRDNEHGSRIRCTIRVYVKDSPFARQSIRLHPILQPRRNKSANSIARFSGFNYYFEREHCVLWEVSHRVGKSSRLLFYYYRYTIVVGNIVIALITLT